MSAPPSFNFYPGDFVKSCVDMDASEIGAYIRLLCYQWEHGAIPNRADKLARICGMDKADFDDVWESLKDRFDDVKGKNLKVQSRLSIQRKKDTETWLKRRAGGSKGGRPKIRDDESREKRKPQGLGQGKPQGSKNKTSTEEGIGNREKRIEGENESISIDECLAVEVPRELNVSEFREAWKSWVEYKQESPHAWTDLRGVRAQLTRLAKHDREAAIAGIWNAISERWQGIFPEKITARANGSAPTQFPEPQKPRPITADAARYRLINHFAEPDARNWDDQKCVSELRSRMLRTA